MKRKDLKSASLTLALCIMLSTAACGQKKEGSEETGRSLQGSDITPITEEPGSDASTNGSGQDPANTGDDSGNTTSDSAESTKEPTWGGAPWNKPSTFDFTLKYSDDLKIVDYGKSTVNVYHANYNIGKEPTRWEDDGSWEYNGTNDIITWCQGGRIYDPWDSFKWSRLDRENALANIHSVESVSLSSLPNGDEVAQKLQLPSDTQVLCWTYEVYDFPWEYYDDAEWVTIPRDLQTTKLVKLDSQYVDGLPLYGGRTYCSGEHTFEWDGVIRPSRLRSDIIPYYYQGVYHKADAACTYTFSTNTYTITDKVLEDQPVVDPTTCLDAIRKALLYDPSFGGAIPRDEDPFLIHIWETDIEVYMMELTYVVLDPEPLEDGVDGDPTLGSHELTLVPVWEVYFTVADQKDERLLEERTLMINAVTGESLYSETYGPNENEALYPHLHDPV
ncbi:MAG: hypothetical protein K6A81_01525 [Clostridiales bacterium]|nr:hypothetical protein [Clostridiales bacterium]